MRLNDGIGAGEATNARSIAVAGRREPTCVSGRPGPSFPAAAMRWQAKQPEVAATASPAVNSATAFVPPARTEPGGATPIKGGPVVGNRATQTNVPSDLASRTGSSRAQRWVRASRTRRANDLPPEAQSGGFPEQATIVGSKTTLFGATVCAAPQPARAAAQSAAEPRKTSRPIDARTDAAGSGYGPVAARRWALRPRATRNSAATSRVAASAPSGNT
jgi:hypothetical protein